MQGAQNNLWLAFETLTHEQWARAYKAANQFGVYATKSGDVTSYKACTSAKDTACAGAKNVIDAATSFTEFAKSSHYYSFDTVSVV